MIYSPISDKINIKYQDSNPIPEENYPINSNNSPDKHTMEKETAEKVETNISKVNPMFKF